MGDMPGCMPAARKGFIPKMPPGEDAAVDVANPAMPIAARNGLSASGSFRSAAVDDDDATADDFLCSFDFLSLSVVLDELLFVAVDVTGAVVVGDERPAMPPKPIEVGSMPGKAKAPGKPPKPMVRSDGLLKGFCIIIICICS